ncbi:hypothetical protein KID36_08725 [Escherichia coli]|nr:hypothetical protein [Escherichia coli]MCQ0340828.1 hypothetical protein [Escherichia coli]
MVRANKRNEALRIESALLNKIAMLGTEKTAEAVGVDKSQISRWKLTAKNADISGSVNANAGTLNNVTINENCQIKGKLSANQIEGDIVKTVGTVRGKTAANSAC